MHQSYGSEPAQRGDCREGVIGMNDAGHECEDGGGAQEPHSTEYEECTIIRAAAASSYMPDGNAQAGDGKWQKPPELFGKLRLEEPLESWVQVLR